jgi:outer membrane lipoprotein-sorting protein
MVQQLSLLDADEDSNWADLFTQLKAPANRFSKFKELRYFPFRRNPVELSGEIRITPELGLSLSYLNPNEQIMIVDEQGILMRDENGRERAASRDQRASVIAKALTNILRFDSDALAVDFDLYGTYAGSEWTLQFRPRELALLKQLGTITVEGTAARLHNIEMRRSDKQRIDIQIIDIIEGVTFTTNEISRFFR